MTLTSRNLIPKASTFYLRIPMLLVALIVFQILGCEASSIDIGFELARRGVIAAATNSCTVTWGNCSAQPSAVFTAPVTHLSMLPSDFDDDIDFDDLELDEQQYEIYRVDRIRKAVQWAQCVANDWPELDLYWCLADWHSGKLIDDSIAFVGETCWWCEWYGWSMDPEVTQKEAYTESCIPLRLALTSAIFNLILHFIAYTHLRMPVKQDWKELWWCFCSGYRHRLPYVIRESWHFAWSLTPIQDVKETVLFFYPYSCYIVPFVLTMVWTFVKSRMG